LRRLERDHGRHQRGVVAGAVEFFSVAFRAGILSTPKTTSVVIAGDIVTAA
jgi:hypothetical protein